MDKARISNIKKEHLLHQFKIYFKGDLTKLIKSNILCLRYLYK